MKEKRFFPEKGLLMLSGAAFLLLIVPAWVPGFVWCGVAAVLLCAAVWRLPVSRQRVRALLSNPVHMALSLAFNGALAVNFYHNWVDSQKMQRVAGALGMENGLFVPLCAAFFAIAAAPAAGCVISYYISAGQEDYRIATLNCGGEDFAVACMRSNLRYGKNQKREDVKSHHYIISFDPRDAADNGLTVDRAQALGEEFCRKQFPGHQAIVCTHPDGHNHSGNIHVHIVINSLRIEEVPFLPYMDRPADTRTGCKHRCTDAAMEYFKAEVMELCHRENLYQIDLLHGSKNRITEREYWAQRKGQAKLDKEAAALPAEEQPAKPTKFETDKEKLRQTIRTALSSAASYGEFAAVLLQQGVTVKESRGRLSYLTPDRTKPITARKLGDDFDRAAVLALLEQNAHRAAEQTATVPEYPRNIRERLQGKKAVQTTPEKDGIQRMVDRAAKRAEGKGAGYDRWAAVHNLKQMAATVAAYGQYGYSPEELDAALVSANADLQDSTAKLKALDAAIREKKELQTQVLAYAKTKPARDGLKAQKTEKARSAYRERHESDFIIADAATRYFRAHGVSKLPSHKALQAEIERLTAEKNAHYNEYREKRARVKELHTVKSNLSQILQGEKDREKKHEHER